MKNYLMTQPELTILSIIATFIISLVVELIVEVAKYQFFET